MGKIIFILMALVASSAAEQTCGQSPSMLDPDSQIAGPIEASPNSHPWMVSLQYKGEHLCAGSLVSMNSTLNETYAIITSTDCFNQKFQSDWDIRVVAGAHKLNSFENVQDVGINYDNRGSIYSIMVIPLASPIKFTPYVQPICLPSLHDVLSKQQGVIAYWGATKEGNDTKVLMQTSVPIIKFEDCREMYIKISKSGELDQVFQQFEHDYYHINKEEFFNSYYIDKSLQFCAGLIEGVKNTCDGGRDDGGLLVVNDGNKFTLQGIRYGGDYNSYCGHPGSPEVYPLVSRFSGVIKRLIDDIIIQ
jgi:hypothetical protein